MVKLRVLIGTADGSWAPPRGATQTELEIRWQVADPKRDDGAIGWIGLVAPNQWSVWLPIISAAALARVIERALSGHMGPSLG